MKSKASHLFVSRQEQGHLSEILDSLKGQSVLTVSDAEGFASTEE